MEEYLLIERKLFEEILKKRIPSLMGKVLKRMESISNEYEKKEAIKDTIGEDLRDLKDSIINISLSRESLKIEFKQ